MIHPGNNPPVPEIELPGDGRFSVGESLVVTGRASDADEGELAPGALSWTVRLRHADHRHPYVPAQPGAEIAFDGPDDFGATGNSCLEVELAATDSRGQTVTTVAELRPRLVDLTVETRPAGLVLEVQASPAATPAAYTSWDGFTVQVAALDQVDTAGRGWLFAGWSDGGAATHDVVTDGDTYLVAEFVPALRALSLPTITGTPRAGSLLRASPGPGPARRPRSHTHGSSATAWVQAASRREPRGPPTASAAATSAPRCGSRSRARAPSGRTPHSRPRRPSSARSSAEEPGGHAFSEQRAPT